VTEGDIGKVMGLLHFLNKKLAATGYLAQTEHMTLADLAVFSMVSTLSAVQVVDLHPYAELEKWRHRVEGRIPSYERANLRGLNKVIQFVGDRAAGK